MTDLSLERLEALPPDIGRLRRAASDENFRLLGQTAAAWQVRRRLGAGGEAPRRSEKHVRVVQLRADTPEAASVYVVLGFASSPTATVTHRLVL